MLPAGRLARVERNGGAGGGSDPAGICAVVNNRPRSATMLTCLPESCSPVLAPKKLAGGDLAVEGLAIAILGSEIMRKSISYQRFMRKQNKTVLFISVS